MWFKCVICQQTYSHKCNLKRHMDTVHLHKVHRCNLCDKEFKRREYLTRHLKQAHNTSSNSRTFSKIADCVSTEQTPFRDYSSPTPTSDLDDVDIFLNTLEDIPIESTFPDACFSPSTSAPSISSLPSVSVCTQTDVCALPPMRQPHTTGTNTTPIFTKDKTTQKGRMLMESGCSPHCRIVSPHLDIQGWDSPVTSPPKTPGWDIPSYFTTTYQEERLRNNLPEAIPYQGPFGEEDPLPPHLAPNPPEWGVVSSSVSPNFQLINFLEDICGNITPPRL